MIRPITALSLLFSAFACTPAAAQERYPSAPAAVPFVEYQPADPALWNDGEVGFFYFYNRLTMGHPEIQIITIQTNVGEVILELNTTKNGDCEIACPDILSVIDWPSGYAVHPISITVPELEMDFITLFETSSS